MSKYTTEVRFICEQKAGLKESAGWTSVDEIINNSYDKIFDVQSIPFFDANHGALLLKKILLHYYTREIGYETVGLWQMKINQKLREIMPYYNQLYKSELLEYNPLENVDNTHTHRGAYEDNANDHYTDRDTGTVGDEGAQNVMLRHKENTNNGKSETKADTITTGNTWTTFQDTPQGALDGIRNENYLTNATHVQDTPAYVDTHTEHTKDAEMEYNKGKKNDNDYKDTTDYSNIRTNNLTHEHTKDRDHKEGEDSYTNKENGKIGTETYQEMVMKYRDTFLNIDMMVIRELGDLFMKVW